jgi:hypothetical protein
MPVPLVTKGFSIQLGNITTINGPTIQVTLDPRPVELFRGDNLDQQFLLTDASGLAIDVTDAELIFSVKETEDDVSPLFQRKNENAGGSEGEIEMVDPAAGKFTVHVIPSNTSSLDGNQFYWYDIQMVKDGKTLTLIKDKLELKTDITT